MIKGFLVVEESKNVKAERMKAAEVYISVHRIDSLGLTTFNLIDAQTKKRILGVNRQLNDAFIDLLIAEKSIMLLK